MAIATPALFTLLAKLITDGNEDKKEQLFQLLDKAFEWNRHLPVAEQIALVAQVAKASLSDKL